jgi:plastocyanin
MKVTSTIVCASLLFAVGAIASTSAVANDGKTVTVAFGAGLNTALTPGNPANHHVIPDTIRIKVGDVVNFVVAGTHLIRVYDRGVLLQDVKDLIPAGCEVNVPFGTPWPTDCFFGVTPPPPAPVIPPLGLGVYYEGLNPFAAPPTGRSTAGNRVETVSFSKTGRFLVICAILPHFNDKMYAWVEVSP